jgi:adenylate cyclase
VLGFARVIGSSSERIADALASATRVGVEVPQREGGMPYQQVVEEYSTMARELLPSLWDAIGAVFRRHLVLVSYEGFELEKSQHAVTLQRAIGFVDLVGSTETLRTQSVPEIARSVNQFERLVGDRVAKAGGRVVKLIGDEAMFAFVDRQAACTCALELIGASPNPVRVGLAFGEVVAMHGDYFGPTVNLAARLVATASPSTLLVSEALRDGVAGDFAFEARETGPLRGFPDVTTAYSARPG